MQAQILTSIGINNGEAAHFYRIRNIWEFIGENLIA